jgi:hypothetical protein
MSRSAADDTGSRLSGPGEGRADDSSGALPPGSRVAEFEVLRVLGDGGFGVVYLAQDLSLGRQVALKEYMPSSLAGRKGMQVTLRSARHADTFAAGLRSFINEAQLLARFDHPALVKVHRFWEANGTAYMVMPYYQGVTLKQHLIDMGTRPSQAWLMQLLAPLIDALSTIHAENCFHRDIAPDNIMLLRGTGQPLLLDFGAARRIISDRTQTLTVIVKPGFAPIEQYAEVPHLKQGPWTDVYALCAVVHYAITGRTPPPAVGRMVNDGFAGLADWDVAGYTPQFLRAIERGLRVRPEDRTASVDQLAAELGLRLAIDLELAPNAAGTELDLMLDLAPPAGFDRTALAPRPAETTADAPAAVAPAAPQVPKSRAGAWLRLARRSRWGLVVMLGAGLAIGVGSWRAALERRVAPAEPAPGHADVAPPLAPPPAAAAHTEVVAAAPVALAPLTPAQRISREFDRIDAARHPDYEVRASADAPRLRIGRDLLSFRVSSNRDGYLYVLVQGPDDSLTLLYPNRIASDNRIRGGQALRLPQRTWTLEASDPPGQERFLAIVSAHPRDFSSLRPVREGWFQRLAIDADRGAAQPGAAQPLYAGVAQCSDPGCDRYGVAQFTVDVEP